VAAALAVALAVGGCAGVSNSLGTAASACFRALPPAKDAVHQGTLLGVRRVSSDTLADRLKNDPTLSTLPSQNLCVFAFRGSYPPGAVAGAHNTTTGRYAIVAVGTVHTSVVAVSVVNQLPTRFRHLH
jgi:hypothetical protein